jgi:predicted O-linked N-acetylglucosamine transferase (SPINDLY family)
MSPVQLQNLLQQGVTHHRAGRLTEALACYTRVRVAAPRNFDAWNLSGVVALQQGKLTEAITWLERSLTLDARSSSASMRLGLALVSAGRSGEAEPHLRRAVAHKPDFVEAWDNLAFCLKTLDRIAEAITCHERALALNPRHASGWFNFGLTLSLAGRSTEALACHDRALAEDANYARGHFGRAQALQQLHRMEEAIAAYGRFLEREPKHFEARSYRLFALNYAGDLTREELFAEHVAFGRMLGEVPAPEFAHDPEPARRLRVAILSPDLRTHSCAYFLEPLLSHLDPAQFEIYLYHDHPQVDGVSQRLRERAACWRNFVGQTNPTVAATIRDDRPEVLIDLAGHTGMTSRLPLFAQHLAPVQISYLGYPNTTGVSAVGYRFTDALADPAGEADLFATEKLVRFAPTAWAYQPPEPAPEPGPLPSSTGAPFTFGCFNNLGKISDAAVQLWSRVLVETPGARLLLKGRGLDDAAGRERYLARFAAHGIDRARIVLVDRTAGTFEHLALYRQLDVALDTFPYHGTTTTCESLWMGAPVVTLTGNRHAARVGTSLLTAVGHPEWVAGDEDEFVRIAVGLAADRAALAARRASLRDEMRRSALLDHAGQAEHFAIALRHCWQEWCARQLATVG